jgi:hypothetical protein
VAATPTKLGGLSNRLQAEVLGTDELEHLVDPLSHMR